MRWLLIALTSLILAACGQAEDRGQVTADLVFVGGYIYTADEGNSRVDAVAVYGDRIIYAGIRSGVEGFIDEATQIINLNGAAMYPGFTDGHGHLLGIGQRELTLNLEDIASIVDLVERVSERAAEAKPGELIFGRGWIETHWPEGRFPTRQDLDPIAPDNPIILRRADGHALVANSRALSDSGVDRDTPIPFGGDILKDENGEPTGILIDRAMALVGGHFDAPTIAYKTQAYEIAGQVYAAYGWTGIHNMGIAPADVELVENLSDNGTLGLRVYNSLDGNNPAVASFFAGGIHSSANGLIQTRSIKLYMDGALGSRGAALLEPYSDADSSGLLVMEKDQVMKILLLSLRLGIQVNTHAIGDRGNRLLLDWYEEAFDAVSVGERAVGEPRWRDEHTQIVHPDDLKRFVSLGIIPSMQPSHAIGDLHFAPSRLGQERLYGAYAWQSLIDSGAIIVGGTDAPVERGDPRIEFYAAVTRQDLTGFSGEGWHPEEAVSRADALKMFTAWPAYASFMEDDLGTIELGKLADFSIFSGDFMTIPVMEILKADTLMTVVSGRIIYRAEGF